MRTTFVKGSAKEPKHRNKSKYASLYVMLIPFVLWYIMFAYKPMYGNIIAFQDYSIFRGIMKSNWVGMEHFSRFLSSPYFFRTLKNTLMLNLCLLAFSFPAPIIFALLLNEVRCKKVKSLVQTLSYMPHFISTVVVAGIVINFLSPSYGIIPILLEKIVGERPYLLVEPKYFRTIYTVMNIWQSMGYGAVVYLAAITSIDSQLYEAAAVDGANKFRQIWHITIPGIMPTVMIMLIMRIGNMLGTSADTIILLYQPATYEVADTISTYVYRVGLQDANYSYSAAVGLFNSLIALLLVWGSNKVSKKITEVGIW